MDIVVLVKQVPDTESLVQIADDGVSIKTQDIKWIMNPYDELAVEEALQIKEAQGGTVTILSLGPEKAIEAIRTALRWVLIRVSISVIRWLQAAIHWRPQNCSRPR